MAGRVIKPAEARERLVRILDDLDDIQRRHMQPVDVARQARRIRNYLVVLGVNLEEK
jgi:hypothetical protein